ncbi:MAG TPA: PASTA domain-containing protein [Thermoanaerobaculia bacterium]|nr:PASTA domain-containing protein [Thermoanaerobaculia bacterium]
MKRGCLGNLLFALVLLAVFGASSYFSFNFFIRGKSLPTPNLVGLSLVDARAVCSDLGLNLKLDDHRRNSDKVPVEHIVWQSRPAGTASLVKRGTTIRVELSAGPLVLRVPDLAGQSPGTAMLRLGQQNLKVGSVAYVSAGVNGIVAADPPKETVVAAQTPVSLLVSVHPPPPAFVMPDLIDQPIDAVRPALERHGLTIGTVKYEAYPGIQDGIVIRQYPLRGAPVTARDPISVVVSKQEETSIIEQPPGTTTQ